MTLLLALFALLGLTAPGMATFPPPPALAAFGFLDFDHDGYRGKADCSPHDAKGAVRWCMDIDSDGEGLWADGSACLPADVQPLDSRLVLTCG